MKRGSLDRGKADADARLTRRGAVVYNNGSKSKEIRFMKKIVYVILLLVLLAATGIGMADHAEVVARAESWVGKAEYERGACAGGVTTLRKHKS